MRRLACILVLLSTACLGQSVFRVQKFCEVGGQKAVTQGLNSVTNIQRSFPRCTVTVYLTGTTTIAAVYSDNLTPPTPLANPFTANVDGSWGFYAGTASCYDVVTSGGNPGDTFPAPFTYSNVCVGGGGGGTGVNPGTPYQVTRYDPTGVNIQDSTGSDNPSNGPTRWVQGLSVEGNAGYRFFVNSSAGTTLNLLVCRDTSVVTITQVTTCPASSNSVFGLADNGAGVTGNVRVAMIGFHPCVFENQTIIGDWAVPSSSNAGQCSDAGASKPTTQQVLGHVTTLNTGADTLATVDLWTGDTISGGGATVAIAPCTIAGCFAYYDTANSIAGDNHTNLDGAGNGQLQSLGLVNTNLSGFWYQQAGPALPTLTGLNRFFFAVNTAFGTTYGLEPWDNAPTVGHCVDIGAGDATGWIKLHDAGNACGAGITFQTNSVNNASQTTLNLIASTNITLTNTSGGNVTIAAAGTSAPQASNPSAPTLTPNTPGSTAYSYAVIGCEDVNCAYHSAISGVTSTSTGNANLATGTMRLTLYADTLYGYRFYKICRTSSSGTPASVGVIATGAGKIFVDNGLVGDGTTCSSTYAANTTQLDTHCLASSLPVATNVMPGAPCGIDAPPTTPNALDDEMTDQFQLPADGNDPFWTWINQNSAAATWTGGMLTLTAPTRGGGNSLNCLSQTAPSTPYTFVMTGYQTNVAGGVNVDTGTGAAGTGLMLTDGTKIELLGIGAINGGNNARWAVGKWTNVTSAASAAQLNTTPQTPLIGWYYKVANDGTTITFSLSTDGISYTPILAEAKGTFLGTITGVGICINNSTGANFFDTDYFRRTQ